MQKKRQVGPVTEDIKRLPAVPAPVDFLKPTNRIFTKHLKISPVFYLVCLQRRLDCIGWESSNYSLETQFTACFNMEIPQSLNNPGRLIQPIIVIWH